MTDVDECGLRRNGAAVHQVHDCAAVLAGNSRVRLTRKIPNRRRVPMIASRQAAFVVQTLLNDCPFTGRCQHESMQINLKAIRDGVVIDARGQATGSGQRIAIQPGFVRDGTKFVGCFSRMPAAPATDINAQLVRAWIQAALQCAHDSSGDPGRMPVHPHDGT